MQLTTYNLRHIKGAAYNLRHIPWKLKGVWAGLVGALPDIGALTVRLEILGPSILWLIIVNREPPKTVQVNI